MFIVQKLVGSTQFYSKIFVVWLTLKYKEVKIIFDCVQCDMSSAAGSVPLDFCQQQINVKENEVCKISTNAFGKYIH
jgi:hypothetical protein